MKKWIVFFSISFALLVFVLSINFVSVSNFVKTVNTLKDTHLTDAEIFDMLYESGNISHIVCVSLSALFVLFMLGANLFFLISIILGKITPISVRENLNAWKEHCAERKIEHKQRKLDKAQAKVEKLQEEIKKDE